MAMLNEGERRSIRDNIKAKSKDLNLIQMWEVIADLELTQPRKTAVPHVWRWNDLYPLLLDAGKTVPIEESERRVLLFANPVLYPKPYMTSTLYGGCSLYNPGEVAPAHRHTPNASRFVLQGDGGFTTIEGEKCTMKRGDLIITPNGTWHDHGNDGKEPVIWIDMLDLPLVESLNATRFEFDYSEAAPGGSNTEARIKRNAQTVSRPLDHSRNLYATGGLVPQFTTHKRGQGIGTPMFVYRWAETLAAFERMRSYEGSPYDGIILEYVNPATGQPVVPTMSFAVQLLRPGEKTRSHRHTSSTAYFAIEGEGTTECDGTTLKWSRNDAFVMPSWTWHSHANASASRDAILYAVSDFPVLNSLGLYREEAKAA